MIKEIYNLCVQVPSRCHQKKCKIYEEDVMMLLWFFFSEYDIICFFSSTIYQLIVKGYLPEGFFFVSVRLILACRLCLQLDLKITQLCKFRGCQGWGKKSIEDLLRPRID